MTDTARIESRLLSSLKRIVGMHPQLASNYTPGSMKDLVKNLSPIDEPFDGKPPKKIKELAALPSFADAMAARNGEFPEGDA